MNVNDKIQMAAFIEGLGFQNLHNLLSYIDIELAETFWNTPCCAYLKIRHELIQRGYTHSRLQATWFEMSFVFLDFDY